jgi:hypothetical protein
MQELHTPARCNSGNNAVLIVVRYLKGTVGEICGLQKVKASPARKLR